MSELIIQSIYRGNKIRNIVKYYNVLPDDIQKIIIKYIRKDYYYNKYKNVLNKIIYKKILNIYFLEGYFFTLLDYIYYNSYRDLSFIFSDICDINRYIDKLIYSYYILNKYHCILKFEEIYEYYYKLSIKKHLFDNKKLKKEMNLFNKNFKMILYNGV